MALIPKEHQGDDSLCQTVGMKYIYCGVLKGGDKEAVM